MAGKSRRGAQRASEAKTPKVAKRGVARTKTSVVSGTTVGSRAKTLAVAEARVGITDRADKRIVGTPKARSAVRQAFLERVTNFFTELADNASESVIAGALAEPTAFATAAHVLAESAVGQQPLEDADRQLAAALAAGARYKEELLGRAGGAYSAEQLAELLGISRQAVSEGRKTHLYFAVPTGSTYAYPKLQLTENGVLPGLRGFLEAFTLPDAWMKLSVLVEHSERLGRSPLEALRAGDVESAVMVAATYGGHGA